MHTPERQGRLAASAAAVLFAAAPASLAQNSSSYFVSHTFNFNTGGAVPVAVFNYNALARAFEPLPGWDVQGGPGQWAIVGPGNFSQQARAGTDRPTPLFFDAGATASVNAAVNNWGGGAYSATMTSAGSAHARIFPNRADATSSLTTSIFAPWSWASGTLTWRPIIFGDVVSGSASARGTAMRFSDPIQVNVLDAAGNYIRFDSFFDVFTEFTNYSVNWDDAGLRAGPGSDFVLNISMPDSPFLSQSGSLQFEIEDGLVTTSLATGFFSTVVLPGIGEDLSDGFTIADLTNLFTFDYDFTSLLDGASLEFILGGDGAAIVPAPNAALLIALAGVTALGRRRRG